MILCVTDFTPVTLPDVTFVDELKLLGVTFDSENIRSKHTDRIV